MPAQPDTLLNIMPQNCIMVQTFILNGLADICLAVLYNYITICILLISYEKVSKVTKRNVGLKTSFIYCVN